jgi:hypothetical protein
MRNVRFCNCDAVRDRQAIDKSSVRMAVNATPARDQIGAEQVARAITQQPLSVLVAVLDLAIDANVGY